jgi:hypothetical protein
MHIWCAEVERAYSINVPPSVAKGKQRQLRIELTVPSTVAANVKVHLPRLRALIGGCPKSAHRCRPRIRIFRGLMFDRMALCDALCADAHCHGGRCGAQR